MAKLTVISSGSQGNAYVIEAGSKFLAIEAGMPLRCYARATDYDTSEIVGLLCGHRHADHSKYIKEFRDRHIPIYSNGEVFEHYGITSKDGKILEPLKWCDIGEFKVMPFPCPHDVQNFGYIIKHREFGKLFFGTDCWSFPYTFKGIDHWLIEANYDDRILAKSDVDEAQKKRLMLSHMSIDYCLQYLHRCHAEESQSITLIHLSSRHSNAENFLHRVAGHFGVPCFIADKNLQIDITRDLI